ncbi:unnamed protein product, partial [Cuscuta epithymum]
MLKSVPDQRSNELNMIASLHNPHLAHIPIVVTPSNECQHPSENCLCPSCKQVFCSQFMNKHMGEHHQRMNRTIVLSFTDLLVWCFSCDAYFDVPAIQALHVAHL